MYSIVFTRRASKALQKTPKNTADLIRDRLARIAADPYAQYTNVTRLQNRPGYRLRVGDWRVIYEVEDDKLVILVLKVGSRGEIYR